MKVFDMDLKKLFELAGVAHLPKAKSLLEANTGDVGDYLQILRRSGLPVWVDETERIFIVTDLPSNTSDVRFFTALHRATEMLLTKQNAHYAGEMRADLPGEGPIEDGECEDELMRRLPVEKGTILQLASRYIEKFGPDAFVGDEGE